MIALIRRFLLFVVGVTLPLQAFSLVDVGFRMTPFKLATAILLAVGAVHFALGRRRPPDNKVPWLVMFAVTFAIGVVHGFFRGIPIPALITASVTFYAILGYYLLIGVVIATRDDLTIMLWGLIVGAVTTATPAVFGLQEASHLGRYSGLSGQENLFGIDMGVTIPLATALFLGTRSRLKKGVLAAVVAIALGGLLLSLSRTAFVSGLAMWCLWLYRSRSVGSIKYVVPAMLLLVGAVLLAPDAVTQRIDTMLDPQKRARDGAIQGRLMQGEFALKAIASNPVLGVGVLSFIPWAQSQPSGDAVTHVIHNAYLRIAVAQGLIGLLPYLMILALSWRQYTAAWRAARSRRKLKDPLLAELGTLAMFLQIALFGTMVVGLAAHSQLSKTAWLVLALSPVVRSLVAQRVAHLDAQRAQAAVEEPERSLPGVPAGAPAPTR